MPKSIKYFEWSMLSASALGIILVALLYPAIPSHLRVFNAVVGVVTIGVYLALVLAISRRGSNWARWLLVGLWGLGLVFYIPDLARFLQSGLVGAIASIQVLLQCLGIYFLFAEDSREWMNSKKGELPMENEDSVEKRKITRNQVLIVLATGLGLMVLAYPIGRFFVGLGIAPVNTIANLLGMGAVPILLGLLIGVVIAKVFKYSLYKPWLISTVVVSLIAILGVVRGG